jgi:serine/threonine protein kinase
LTQLGFANAPKLISLTGNSFTMEMIEGTSLRGREPVDEQLFLRVLGVVRQLHTLGFAHGNLRPNNILITEKGEPFLIDFETCCLRSNLLFHLAKFTDYVRLRSLWQSRVVKSDQGRMKTTFPRHVTVVMFFLTPLNKVVGAFKSLKKRLRRSRKVSSVHRDASPGPEILDGGSGRTDRAGGP